jgi:translation initiation factor IF-3
LTIEQALVKAGEAGLDLVEISPTAKPPVCKIMDYGKFKYEEKKRQSQAKKKQVVVQLKEVKLRPRTDEHDYDFKMRNVRRFLEEGNKSKLTIMFRGREIVHKEIGQKILMKVIEELKDVGVVEQTPRMEGRQMFMVLAPNPKWKGKPSSGSQQAKPAAPAAPRPQPASPPATVVVAAAAPAPSQAPNPVAAPAPSLSAAPKA